MAFSFEKALVMLKTGHKVTRTGWNGKGMYITLQKAYPGGIPINGNTAEATELPEGTVCRFLPYIMMRTADGAFVPWVASHTDLLNDDWQWVSDANQAAPAPRPIRDNPQGQIDHHRVGPRRRQA